MSHQTLVAALTACIAEADLAGSAHSLPMVDAHTQKIAAIARDALSKAKDVVDADQRDAARFRKLCALLQAANYGEGPTESDALSVYCSMLSGWRDEKTMKAVITWKDKRDVDELDFGAALDAVNLCLGGECGTF